MTPLVSKLLAPPALSARASVGLLAPRLVVGLALILHGLPKLANPLGWMGPDAWAPGPLQALAVLSEVGGGAAIVLGLLTPLASLGVLATMAVAAWTHISRGDPFVGRSGSYELALVYAAIAALFLVAGPGRYAVDAFVFGPKPR
jgi:putative oxidoreductase